MKKLCPIPFGLTLLLLFISYQSFATHNRSGEITYKRIPPFTQVINNVTVPVYTYSITVTKYMNSGQNIADRCVDTVYFGDGSTGIAPRVNGPTCGNCSTPVTCGVILSPAPSYVVKQSIYSIVHTYTGSGSFMIRSFDPNRTGGIINIPNSVSQPFYIESLLVIGSTFALSSPILTNPPIDNAFLGNCFYHNMGAFDPDGDSLSYELSTCRGTNGQTVPGYSLPDPGTGGSISVDAVTGTFTWCKPQQIGIYSIAILVKKWRRNPCAATQLVGSVLRDMEIMVFSNPGTIVFTSAAPQDICVSAGAVITKTIIATVSPTSLSIIPGLYGVTSYTPLSPTASITPSSAGSSITAVVTWSTTCPRIQKQPHKVLVKFNVSTPPGTMVFYRDFNVTVLPPTPVIHTILKDTSRIELRWKSLSSCVSKLAGYQIYRKIGNNSWNHGPCETGLPATSGFSLIGNASSTDTSFVDYDLWTMPNGSTGNYIVTAVTSDCLESFADSIRSTILIIGLDENQVSNHKIRLHPNPFNNGFTLDLDGVYFPTVDISVYSADGKLLFEKSVENADQNIAVVPQLIAQGIYFVSVRTLKGTSFHKMVKE